MTSACSSLYLRSIPVREAWGLLQVREPEATHSPLLQPQALPLPVLFVALFWAVASNLATRGQQRHRFGTARVLAKFSSVLDSVVLRLHPNPFTPNSPRSLR